jgi:hypothetical protein
MNKIIKNYTIFQSYSSDADNEYDEEEEDEMDEEDAEESSSSSSEGLTGGFGDGDQENGGGEDIEVGERRRRQPKRQQPSKNIAKKGFFR